MRYRPEVDGIRTIAVIPVVLFHAGLPGFSGGFAGVDVFFVISGFLITSLLIEDLRQERFSLVNFYERRARRILPALVLVIAATTIMAFVTLPPARLAEYGASMIASALFAANFYFWESTDYFATAAEERPLLHIWSLAVEEQFYVVFPLLLLLLWRWRRNNEDTVVWAIFLGLALLSFSLAVFSASWKPTASFYLPATRAWELLAGALVAVAVQETRSVQLPAGPWLAGLGLALITAALLGVDKTTLWPGPYTLLPVLGAVLVLAFARPNCPTGRFLSHGAMVQIGLLSYAIYLWHQPLLAFAHIVTPGEPSRLLMGTLALATLPLSWLTWRFVEQPFRRRAHLGGFSRRALFSASAASTLLVAAIGATLAFSPSVTERIYTARLTDAELARYRILEAVAPDRHAALLSKVTGPCRQNFTLVTQEAIDTLLRCTEGGAPAVIVVGGSHGDDLHTALLLATDAEVILGFTRGYCRPHRRLNSLPPVPHECPFEGVKNLVASHADRIGLLMYTQAGFTVFEDYRRVRNPEGLRRDLLEEAGDYLASLAAHVPIVALGPKPVLGINVRSLSIKAPLEGQIEAAQFPGISAAMRAVNEAYAEILEDRNVPFLSHADAIGSVLPRDAMLEGALTYRDQDHWSIHGARIFGARLTKALGAFGYGELVPPADGS